MLRVAILNLNKRLNSQASRGQLLRWIERAHVNVLVGVEPWRTAGRDCSYLADLHSIGGTNRVHVWVDRAFEPPPIKLMHDRWMRVELGYFVVYGVYLDAYKQTTRASELIKLRQDLETEGARPVLVAGDFNIAPQLADGLLNEKPSKFNSAVDRQPLQALCQAVQLVDLGAHNRSREWTIERVIAGRASRFRCDLALLSDYMEPDVRFSYDHSVRVGDDVFTDHSAIVVDLPTTLEAARAQTELFARHDADEERAETSSVAAEKTAMHRRDPSSIAVRVVRPIVERNRYASVLDYGCGYGEDVEYYASLGLRVDGFDPHPGFGRTTKPEGLYDVVTVVFVLNVLPNPWERLGVIQQAARYVAPGGVLILASRSPDEILRQAKDGDWREFNDGYWSHEGRRTFQKGISKEEVLRLAHRIGLRGAMEVENGLELPANVTCVILRAQDEGARNTNPIGIG